jgi:hypothetical protein
VTVVVSSSMNAASCCTKVRRTCVAQSTFLSLAYCYNFCCCCCCCGQVSDKMCVVDCNTGSVALKLPNRCVVKLRILQVLDSNCSNSNRCVLHKPTYFRDACIPHNC